MVSKPTGTEWTHRKPCYIDQCEVCLAEIKALAAEPEDVKASPYCDTHILVWEHIPGFAIDLRRCQMCPYFDGKAMTEELEKQLWRARLDGWELHSEEMEQQLQLARIEAKIEERQKLVEEWGGPLTHVGGTISSGIHILTAQKAHLTTKGDSDE